MEQFNFNSSNLSGQTGKDAGDVSQPTITIRKSTDPQYFVTFREEKDTGSRWAIPEAPVELAHPQRSQTRRGHYHPYQLNGRPAIPNYCPLIQFKVTSPTAVVPQTAVPRLGACIELAASEQTYFQPDTVKTVPLSLLVKIPFGFYATVYPVSNLGKIFRPLQPLLLGGPVPHSLDLDWINTSHTHAVNIPQGRVFAYISLSRVVFPELKIITDYNESFV